MSVHVEITCCWISVFPIHSVGKQPLAFKRETKNGYFLFILLFCGYSLAINSSLEHLYGLTCVGINLSLSEVVANFLLSLKKQSSPWYLDLRKKHNFLCLTILQCFKYFYRQRKQMLILSTKARMPTGSFQPVLCATGWSQSPFKEGSSHNLQKLWLYKYLLNPFLAAAD